MSIWNLNIEPFGIWKSAPESFDRVERAVSCALLQNR
jgi:hypothetical protein